ncbi:Odorant receptor Or56 [Rhyzopertha dominica]|nr:Odorant receptor Or56 [Rhyzopertha dominica]
MLTAEDSLSFALQLTSYIGLHPFQNNNLRGKVMRILPLVASGVALPLIIIKMFLAGNNTDVWVAQFEAFATYYQTLTKIYIFRRYQKNLELLLTEMRSMFWKTEDVNLDQQTKDEINFTENSFHMFGLYYVRLAVLTIFIFTARSIVKRELLFDVWLPDDPHTAVFVVLYFAEVFSVWYTTCLVGGHDVMFSALCCKVAIQYKILGYVLEHTKPEDVDKDFSKKCVTLHDFLFRCEQETLKVFTISLSNQYSMSVITVCVELYLMFESSDNFRVMCCFSYIVLALVELGCICVPPSVAEYMSEGVGRSAYLSKWYETRNKSVVADWRMIILRSQRPFQYNAAGVVKVNVECYVRIVNMGISVFTVLRTRKNY